MHASVLKVKIKPDKVAEAVRIYEASQPSNTQTKAGAQGFLLLIDKETGEGYSIGLWTSEEAARKFDTVVLHENLAQLHRDQTIHDVLATAFPAGDHQGALPAYESVIAKFAGVFASEPAQSIYEVGATAGHLDVLQGREPTTA